MDNISLHSNIHLDNEEIQLLEMLAAKKDANFFERYIDIEDISLGYESLYKLRNYKFIGVVEKPSGVVTKDGYSQMRIIGYYIATLGYEHLLYLGKGKRQEAKSDRRYWITTSIALFALAISIIALLFSINIISLC